MRHSMTQAAIPLPDITAAFLSKGRNTVGHETNLARSPLWHMRKRASNDETVVSPFLYGHPFRQVAGSHLTTSDQYLFAYLTTRFLRAGCPEDRRVPFSLGDASTALGYDALGGKQRRLVRQSLARLGSVVLESAVRHPDGHETVIGWRLVDSYLITTRGGGRGWVAISEAVGGLLREGSVTYLNAPTWRAIRDDDEVAGRLWSFLESERIGHGWHYSLLTTPGGTPASVPSIAEVLQLDWAAGKEVAKRVRRACAVLAKHDPRYRLQVSVAAKGGNWVLTCNRVTERRAIPATDSGLPDSVIRAWRRAYRSHLPSARQRRVLTELLSRHSSRWVEETLASAGHDGLDPLKRLLTEDRVISGRRMTEARSAEEAWEAEKSRESASAESSLAELIAEVTGQATSR